jgi:hypothetical protein
MGVYERWVLPRMLDLAMRNRLLDHYRQRTIDPVAKPAAHSRAESRGSRPSKAAPGRETDSPLEGTGFELAVPRRNESRDRPVLLALCGLADDERRLVLARYPPRVVTLSLCRRRHKAADLGREQPGEFDCCRVLARRPDDLQGDR